MKHKNPIVEGAWAIFFFAWILVRISNRHWLFVLLAIVAFVSACILTGKYYVYAHENKPNEGD